MTINYEYVQIELPYEILRIEDIHLIAEVNEHITLNLEALINEEDAEKYLEESVEGKEIKLIINQSTIYVGKIIELEICYKGQVAHMKLKTISYSYDLDIKKHNQAFYNLQNTYEDVIKNVLSKYSNTDFKDNITYGKPIKDLLVQYEETDFEFLKRLATHFETVLVVDAARNMSRFHFGIEPINNEIELRSEFREVKTKLSDFTNIMCTTKDELNQQNFIGWQVENKEYLPLGTQLAYDGQKVIVVRIEMKQIKGEIIYLYDLKFIAGVKTIYKINSKLKGISLDCIVKNRRNNEMQLQFCINDSYEEADGNKWLAYGREVSSFYCMPVLESRVRLTFLSGDEKDTIVTNGVHIAGDDDKYYSKISDPSNKSYSTVDGQEVLITPDMIQIAADDGKSVQVTLGKDGDVSITSENISLSASKNIGIGVGKEKPSSINISAQNQVIITRSSGKEINTGHAIELNEENHFKGIIKLG